MSESDSSLQHDSATKSENSSLKDNSTVESQNTPPEVIPAEELAALKIIFEKYRSVRKHYPESIVFSMETFQDTSSEDFRLLRSIIDEFLNESKRQRNIGRNASIERNPTLTPCYVALDERITHLFSLRHLVRNASPESFMFRKKFKETSHNTLNQFCEILKKVSFNEFCEILQVLKTDYGVANQNQKDPSAKALPKNQQHMEISSDETSVKEDRPDKPPFRRNSTEESLLGDFQTDKDYVLWPEFHEQDSNRSCSSNTNIANILSSIVESAIKVAYTILHLELYPRLFKYYIELSSIPIFVDRFPYILRRHADMYEIMSDELNLCSENSSAQPPICFFSKLSEILEKFAHDLNAAKLHNVDRSVLDFYTPRSLFDSPNELSTNRDILALGFPKRFCEKLIFDEIHSLIVSSKSCPFEANYQELGLLANQKFLILTRLTLCGIKIDAASLAFIRNHKLVYLSFKKCDFEPCYTIFRKTNDKNWFQTKMLCIELSRNLSPFQFPLCNNFEELIICCENEDFTQVENLDFSMNLSEVPLLTRITLFIPLEAKIQVTLDLPDFPSLKTLSIDASAESVILNSGPNSQCFSTLEKWYIAKDLIDVFTENSWVLISYWPSPGFRPKMNPTSSINRAWDAIPKDKIEYFQ